MGTVSARLTAGPAIAFQDTRVLHARTFVPISAVGRASALMGGACASQASLVSIALSQLVVVVMEIARFLAHAFAVQAGSAHSAKWQCNVPTHRAVDMALAQMDNVHA